MLSQEQILKNKNEVVQLINSLDGYDTDTKSNIINFLTNNGYFTAPASTKFHNCYEGGLCEHSLIVFHILENLVKYNGLVGFQRQNLILASLFHEVAKCNYYEQYERNIKDVTGKWVTVKEYRIADSKYRFVGSSLGVNSFLILNTLCETDLEVQQAIINSHFGLDKNAINDDLPAVLKKYPLVVYLHTADLMATYTI